MLIGLCNQEQQDCLGESSAQHNQQDRETKPPLFKIKNDIENVFKTVT